MLRPAQVLLTVQMQLAESTTLNKVLDFELRHLTAQELPQLKVRNVWQPQPAAPWTEPVAMAPSSSGCCCCCCARQAEIERSAKLRSEIVNRLQDHEGKMSEV